MCPGPDLCPLRQQSERQRSYWLGQHIIWGTLVALGTWVLLLIVW
jgi:hypothetical protein